MRKGLKSLLAVVLAIILAASSIPAHSEAAVKKTAVASTQGEIDEALKNKKLTKLIIRSDEGTSLTVKKGSYPNLTVSIEAPNALIRVRADVKTIYAKEAKALYVYASVGRLKVTDDKLTVRVMSKARVASLVFACTDAADKLYVYGAVDKLTLTRRTDLTITDKGDIDWIKIKKPSNVSISGTAKDRTIVTVTSAAEDSAVKASVPVKVNAYGDTDLTLKEGAEGSAAYIKKADASVDMTNNTSSDVEIKNYDGTAEKVAPSESGISGETGETEPAGDADNTTEEPGTGNTEGGGTIVPPVPSGDVAVTGITLDHTSIEYTIPSVGAALYATITPSNATDKRITWTSSNEAVATVNASGMLALIAPGTTVITATTANGKTASCRVTVLSDETEVSVSAPRTYIGVGGTVQLSASVTPDSAGSAVNWTSSDASVASVDTDGVVTGISTGSAVITATAVDGLGAFGNCTIVVTTAAEALQRSFAAGESDIVLDGDITGSVTLEYTGATEVSSVTIDFGRYTISGDVTINAGNIEYIYLIDDGIDDSGAVITGKLTVNAPDSHVENSVYVLGDTDIVAVSDHSYVIDESANVICVIGEALIDVKDTGLTNPGIFILTDAFVQLRGAISKIEVRHPAADINIEGGSTVDNIVVTSEAFDEDSSVSISGGGKVDSIESEAILKLSVDTNEVKTDREVRIYASSVESLILAGGDSGDVLLGHGAGIEILSTASDFTGNVIVNCDMVGNGVVGIIDISRSGDGCDVSLQNTPVDFLVKNENQVVSVPELEVYVVSSAELIPEEIDAFVGQKPDFSQIKLKVSYDGTDVTQNIPVTSDMIAAYTIPDEVSVQTISISYAGAIHELTVNYKQPELSGVSLGAAPDKQVYSVGESPELDGLAVIETYEDGSKKKVNYSDAPDGFSCSKTFTAVSSSESVTVTYKGYNVEFFAEVVPVWHRVDFMGLKADGVTAYFFYSTKVQSGNTVVEPGHDTIPGMVFEGWYAAGSGTPYDFKTPVAASLTLEAHYRLAVTDIASLEKALDAAELGDTIVLEDDIVLSEGTLVIPADLILDAAEHTITVVSDGCIQLYGTLKLSRSQFILGSVYRPNCFMMFEGSEWNQGDMVLTALDQGAFNVLNYDYEGAPLRWEICCGMEVTSASITSLDAFKDIYYYSIGDALYGAGTKKIGLYINGTMVDSVVPSTDDYIRDAFLSLGFNPSETPDYEGLTIDRENKIVTVDIDFSSRIVIDIPEDMKLVVTEGHTCTIDWKNGLDETWHNGSFEVRGTLEFESADGLKANPRPFSSYYFVTLYPGATFVLGDATFTTDKYESILYFNYEGKVYWSLKGDLKVTGMSESAFNETYDFEYSPYEPYAETRTLYINGEAVDTYTRTPADDLRSALDSFNYIGAIRQYDITKPVYLTEWAGTRYTDSVITICEGGSISGVEYGYFTLYGKLILEDLAQVSTERLSEFKNLELRDVCTISMTASDENAVFYYTCGETGPRFTIDNETDLWIETAEGVDAKGLLDYFDRCVVNFTCIGNAGIYLNGTEYMSIDGRLEVKTETTELLAKLSGGSGTAFTLDKTLSFDRDIDICNGNSLIVTGSRALNASGMVIWCNGGSLIFDNDIAGSSFGKIKVCNNGSLTYNGVTFSAGDGFNFELSPRDGGYILTYNVITSSAESPNDLLSRLEGTSFEPENDSSYILIGSDKYVISGTEVSEVGDVDELIQEISTAGEDYTIFSSYADVDKAIEIVGFSKHIHMAEGVTIGFTSRGGFEVSDGARLILNEAMLNVPEGSRVRIGLYDDGTLELPDGREFSAPDKYSAYGWRVYVTITSDGIEVDNDYYVTVEPSVDLGDIADINFKGNGLVSIGETVYEIAVTESGGILSNSLREMTAYGEFYLQNIDFDDYDSPIILTEDVDVTNREVMIFKKVTGNGGRLIVNNRTSLNVDAIEVGSVMDWNLFEAVSGGTTMDIYTTPARPRAGILPGVLMTTGTEGVHAIIANLSENCEMHLSVTFDSSKKVNSVAIEGDEVVIIANGAEQFASTEALLGTGLYNVGEDTVIRLITSDNYDSAYDWYLSTKE